MDRLVVDEHHKSHRGTREKLKKKRKQEKEHKKLKKIKKKDYESSKPLEKHHEKRNKKSRTAIDVPKILKKLPKFLTVFNDDIENFYGIFAAMDQGESVNIEGLENPNIKRKLAKIFKYLKMVKSGDGEYSKNPEIHRFSLKEKMRELVEESFFREKSSESESGKSVSDEENSQDLSQKLSGLKGKLPSSVSEKSEIQPKIKNEKPSEVPEERPLANPIEGLERKIEETPQITTKKVYGVQFISPEEKALFLENALPPASEKREEWLGQDNLSKLIDSEFNKLNSHAAHPSKRVPKYLQTLFEKEPEKMRKALEKSKEEREDEEAFAKSQAEMKEYMRRYDEANDRGKSLLEVHKEKLGMTKGKRAERREFNRETDLAVIRHDSKKIFATLNQGENSLGNRFKNSKFEKSFL